MRSIRSKDMLPEMAVRSLTHKLGFRFRLHRKDLPGKPDLVLASKRKVIFVHGCFWHSHGCSKAHVPKSNVDYWIPKLARNQQRDRRSLAELRAFGWKPLVIWECETGDAAKLTKRLIKFLTSEKRRTPAKRGKARTHG